MAGLRPPSSGAVIRSNGAMGYVPHGDTIPAALPLARALRYTARLRRVADPDAMVDEVLQELDLAGRAAVPIGELSGGERKRAAIAAELLARPGLFFLDEPTDGLDPARGREVMRALRDRCDRGATVVLTTQSPLDADRCDKVTVLATGGHLVFFGTPGAALAYFGADNLEEVYERLAGLGDPAEAWSRRFFQFYRTIGGVSFPSVPPQPGPPGLVGDNAGPHSAGPARPGRHARPERPVSPERPERPEQPERQVSPEGPPTDDVTDAPPGAPAGAGRGEADGLVTRALRPVRQWAVLAARDTDGLLRTRRTRAVLAGAPAAVLVALLLLFPSGAFSPAHPNPEGDVSILFWTVFGAFFIGLVYGLPHVYAELGVLRRERFAGLGAGTYVLAKAAVLLPAVAVADALVLAVLVALGRLPAGAGFGATFVTLLLSSAVASGLGLLVSAVVSQLSRAVAGAAAVCLPQVLFAGALLPASAMVLAGRWLGYLMPERWGFDALGRGMDMQALWGNGRSALGSPVLASYGTEFSRPVWDDWLVLAAFSCVLLAAAVAVVARRTPVPVLRHATAPGLSPAGRPGAG